MFLPSDAFLHPALAMVLFVVLFYVMLFSIEHLVYPAPKEGKSFKKAHTVKILVATVALMTLILFDMLTANTSREEAPSSQSSLIQEHKG